MFWIYRLGTGIFSVDLEQTREAAVVFNVDIDGRDRFVNSLLFDEKFPYLT